MITPLTLNQVVGSVRLFSFPACSLDSEDIRDESRVNFLRALPRRILESRDDKTVAALKTIQGIQARLDPGLQGAPETRRTIFELSLKQLQPPIPEDVPVILDPA